MPGEYDKSFFGLPTGCNKRDTLTETHTLYHNSDADNFTFMHIRQQKLWEGLANVTKPRLNFLC